MIATVGKSVISLFLIILVGVFSSKQNIITPEINKGLINILLKITLPFMIVTSFMTKFDDHIKSNIVKAFYYSFITYIILIIVSYILLLPVPIKGNKRTIIHFANVFANTGYVGLPLLNVLFQTEGVIYGSIFTLFYNMFVWTYGVFLFRGQVEKDKLKHKIVNLLLNPTVIAVIIGIFVMVFSIQVSDILLTSMNYIGSITGPLSMLVVGVILSDVKFKNYLTDWTLYYGLIIKLALIPMVFYIIFMLMNDSSILAYSIIILVALPSGTMTSILAERYDMEKDFATTIVLLTTLFSIITLPLLVNMIL